MTRDDNSPLKAYIHQCAWLQYAYLAVSAASNLYSQHYDYVHEAVVTYTARHVYEHSIRTAINYFTGRAAADQPPLPGLNHSSLHCLLDV